MMRDVVKNISQTLSYLSERTDREDYKGLVPEGVMLWTKYSFVMGLVSLSTGMVDRVVWWLWKLTDGYLSYKADEVWREFAKQDKRACVLTLRLFFPKPIKLRRVYNALVIWRQTLHPKEFEWFIPYIIEHKDEMRLYDELYPYVEDAVQLKPEELKQFLKKLYSIDGKLKYFRENPDKTYTVQVEKKLQFYYISILLHAYIFSILRKMFLGRTWPIKKWIKCLPQIEQRRQG
jgi:hypothetical protein